MDYPRLRYVEVFPTELSGKQVVCLRDPLSYSDRLLFLPIPAFFIVSLFDGQHTIVDIQAKYMRRFGELLFSDHINKLIDQLDEALMLDSERFRRFRQKQEERFRQATLRPAAHAGTAYEKDPQRLMAQLEGFFATDGGPGRPHLPPLQAQLEQKGPTASMLKGLIAPHIDPRRGGTCMAWAYRELGEAPTGLPDLYVILGTAHHPTRHLFALTAKDFDTPLGLAETDRQFLTQLEKAYGDRGHPDDLYADEFAHRSEHSVEFQVILLQYLHRLAGQQTPIRILPILCGSFHELVASGTPPHEFPLFQHVVAALKQVITQSGLRVCLIAGADLAHVGLRFGDPTPPDPTALEALEGEDRQMLDHIQRRDLDGLFRNIQKDQDRRRICGFPCIYTLLSLLEGEGAVQGRFLKYQQDVDRQSGSVVTFTSMAFYGTPSPP